MNLGILSDTHDNLPKIKKAVVFFNKKKVDFVMHAGDFIAPFTLNELKKLSCDWIGVFGNNDGEKKGLIQKSEGRIKEGPLRMKFKNKKVTLVHDLNTLNAKGEKADLIIFGHTHKPEIIKSAQKLMVNPGECSGWLTAKSTVALADLDSLSARIIKI
jgi:putative phosphoesterase